MENIIQKLMLSTGRNCFNVPQGQGNIQFHIYFINPSASGNPNNNHVIIENKYKK